MDVAARNAIMSSKKSKNHSTNNNASVVSSDYVNADNDESTLEVARMATAAAEHAEDPSSSRGHANTEFATDQNLIHSASGFQRLHRDYLKDLDDDVVMSLPWGTTEDIRRASEVLRRRSVARRQATQITILVIGYLLLSILSTILLYGVVASVSWMMTCQGLSYVVFIGGLLYVHYRYYKLDSKVQSMVRANMDANGLGFQEVRDRSMLRSEPSQKAVFILPEFIDVMLRSAAAAEDSDDISVVTFRESWMWSSKRSSSTSGTSFSLSKILGKN